MGVKSKNVCCVLINVKKITKKICCKLFFYYFCTPFLNGQVDSVAQLVEQYTFNVWALGSSPSGITSKAGHLIGFFYCNHSNNK